MDRTEYFYKETNRHVRNVQRLMNEAVQLLLQRAMLHDQSKFIGVEKELFTEVIPKLGRVKYGSDEYKAILEKIKPAIERHNKCNSHHPEHYRKGVVDMDLLDLLEMLCDWFASTKRSPGGDILKSIEISQKRFGYSDELKSIFATTVRRYLLPMSSELEEHESFEETE